MTSGRFGFPVGCRGHGHPRVRRVVRTPPPGCEHTGEQILLMRHFQFSSTLAGPGARCVHGTLPRLGDVGGKTHRLALVQPLLGCWPSIPAGCRGGLDQPPPRRRLVPPTLRDEPSDSACAEIAARGRGIGPTYPTRRMVDSKQKPPSISAVRCPWCHVGLRWAYGETEVRKIIGAGPRIFSACWFRSTAPGFRNWHLPVHMGLLAHPRPCHRLAVPAAPHGPCTQQWALFSNRLILRALFIYAKST